MTKKRPPRKRCPDTQKISFPNRLDAERYIALHAQRSTFTAFNTYRCHLCHHWHMATKKRPT